MLTSFRNMPSCFGSMQPVFSFIPLSKTEVTFVQREVVDSFSGVTDIFFEVAIKISEVAGIECEVSERKNKVSIIEGEVDDKIPGVAVQKLGGYYYKRGSVS